MDKSGATISIANKIMSIVGTKNPYNALVALFMISAIVSIIFILLFMKYSLSKSLHKKEGFHVSEKVESIVVADNHNLPPFTISLLPIITLLALILLFSHVNYIIIIALIVAILISAVLFRKYIPQQKEILNQGATESLGSTIATGSTIAFGSITTSVPAFMGVFQLIQSIPGPPVLSLMIGTGLISGITASAVGAIGIAVKNFSPLYLEMGLSPEPVHRAIAIASGALAIVPYSGFLIVFNKLTGLSMKDTFKNGFISISVTHWLAMVVVVIMAMLGFA